MDALDHHRTPGHDPQETRNRILDAAQALFAEKGFDATSVRDITATADCNVAAVNYHFGGKENLYVESFRALLGALRDQRLAVLEALMERDPAPTLEAFLETLADGFLTPLEDERRGRLLMLFVSREIFDPRLPKSIFAGEFIEPMMSRAAAALDRVEPAMDPDDAALCLMSMVGQLMHALKAQHFFAPHDRPGHVPDRDDVISHFVRYSAGGIRACAGQDPARVSVLASREES
jgi:AcrR family transcriptional regulator